MASFVTGFLKKLLTPHTDLVGLNPALSSNIFGVFVPVVRLFKSSELRLKREMISHGVADISLLFCVPSASLYIAKTSETLKISMVLNAFV